LLASVLDRLVGNRVTAREEERGLDLALHGETAYELAPPPPSGAKAAAPADVVRPPV
jgi:hypothetical protein